MDQNRSEERGEILGPVHEGVDGNLSHLVEGVVIDAVDGNSLGGRAGIGGEAGTSGEVGKDLGSEKGITEGLEEVKGQDKYDQESIGDNKLLGVDQGTSYNSNHLVNQEVIETVVVIDSFESEYVNENNMKLEAKVNESGLNFASMKVPEGASETDKQSCVIDIKCSSRKKFSENSEGGQICRICHLASVHPLDESETTVGPAASSATSSDLIQLGCACKDELGIAHVHCAEAWFKLKGNRYMFLPNTSF